MTTSSRDVLPARSPMPLTVHSICRAPALTAARALAVAMPRSLWQWAESVTFSLPGTWFRMPANSAPYSSGDI